MSQRRSSRASSNERSSPLTAGTNYSHTMENAASAHTAASSLRKSPRTEQEWGRDALLAPERPTKRRDQEQAQQLQLTRTRPPKPRPPFQTKRAARDYHTDTRRAKLFCLTRQRLIIVGCALASFVSVVILFSHTSVLKTMIETTATVTSFR